MRRKLTVKAGDLITPPTDPGGQGICVFLTEIPAKFFAQRERFCVRAVRRGPVTVGKSFEFGWEIIKVFQSPALVLQPDVGRFRTIMGLNFHTDYVMCSVLIDGVAYYAVQTEIKNCLRDQTFWESLR